MSSTGVSDPRHLGTVLKIALFATGCAGIVAEFVLSTLATYLIGNAIFQWTMVMSMMLFAMGVGSRISRLFRRHLLETFILVEFALSTLCAVSAMLAYAAAGYTDYTDLLIYLLALMIGGLIGLEIPLVTRVNNTYEELRINISGVMEKDYYGALLGGVLFAFFALPHLGLTYTPIILGTVNFLVAGLVLWRFFFLLERRRMLISIGGVTLAGLAAIAILAQPVIIHGEQKKYVDKIIYSDQTPYQKIVMTQWRQHHWLYLNGQQQFSTYDEERYHEPLVHPATVLAPDARRVLILGGGDGLALREVLKHGSVDSVTLVDLDPAMTDLARTHPVLVTINDGSLNHPAVSVINTDAGRFVEADETLYDVIIVDLPDPDTVDLMHLYDVDFYASVRRHLTRGGVFVTQAASPFFSRRAFQCILRTVRAAGFTALPYHNPIPTMGEWGWVLGVRAEAMDAETLKDRVLAGDYDALPTRFLNGDAVVSMVHFGRGVISPEAVAEVEVNRRGRPVLHRYYADGTWGIY